MKFTTHTNFHKDICKNYHIYIYNSKIFIYIKIYLEYGEYRIKKGRSLFYSLEICEVDIENGQWYITLTQSKNMFYYSIALLMLYMKIKTRKVLLNI